MADMPIGQPLPDDPTESVTGDLFPQATDEQIEAALDVGTPLPSEDETLTEEPSVEEPTPDGEAPVEPEPEVEAVPQTPEERIAALESAWRLERLEREKAEAIAERERFLHSRNAGELGHLKQLLSAKKTDDEYSHVDESTSRPEYDEIRSEINTLKSERVQQGVAEEVANFQRAFPEAVKDESALTEIVQRKMPEYQEFLNGTDPKLARTMVRSLLKESYAELRIEREQAAKTAAVTTSYDQAEKMKARKVAAGSSSAARTVAQKPQPKTIDDLTDAELDALTDEHVRNSA